jgi:hypothetical protein
VFRESAPVAMTRSISGFFDELASRGHEPLLRKVTGSARFDVVAGQRTEHWLLDHMGVVVRPGWCDGPVPHAFVG